MRPGFEIFRQHLRTTLKRFFLVISDTYEIRGLHTLKRILKNSNNFEHTRFHPKKKERVAWGGIIDHKDKNTLLKKRKRVTWDVANMDHAMMDGLHLWFMLNELCERPYTNIMLYFAPLLSGFNFCWSRYYQDQCLQIRVMVHAHGSPTKLWPLYVWGESNMKALILLWMPHFLTCGMHMKKLMLSV